MMNLFMAGLRRYWRSTVFWVSVIAALLIGAFCGNLTYENQYVDVAYFLFMQLLYAVLLSLSIGREWDEGGLRNKVISGHRKATVFLVELLLGICAVLVLTLVSLLPFALLCGGFFPIDAFHIGMDCLLGLLLLCVVSAVIDVALCMLIPVRAVSAVLCILLVLGMALAVDRINSRLHQPEELCKVSTRYSEETGLLEYQREYYPNPQYVGGNTRKLYSVLVKLIPFGQANEYMEIIYDCTRPDRDEAEINTDILSTGVFYSIGLAVVLTATGTALFRRKDMK